MKQNRSLIGELLERLDDIAQNTGYPEQFSNERCLSDHHTYLNLCKYIFPELEDYLKTIEDIEAEPADKLNMLLELLSQVIRFDLSMVGGAEIIRMNLSHIEHLIVVLYEYSKILKTSQIVDKIHTEKNEASERQFQIQGESRSARDPAKQYQHQYSHRNKRNSKKDKETHYRQDNGHKKDAYQAIDQNKPQNEQKQVRFVEENQYLLPAEEEENSNAGQRGKKAKSNRKGRNQKAERENLHSCVVNTILREKTRMLEAGVRDNRKNHMKDIEQAKEEYKTYLWRFTKQNKANNNRQVILGQKSASAVKPLKKELPQEDFDKIDNFFQSFAYQFRDKKAAYLRKITSLIRKQEIDRFCYHNRIERETKEYMEDKLQKQLEAARHQHRVKSALIRESAQNLEAQVKSMMKEEKKIAADQKRELRQSKKRELKQIENVLREDNQRVLRNFEDGGRLQGLIMKMYKRF